AVNAQCLCRHHHNVKTSRRVDCEIGAGGVVTWQIGDRKVVTTRECPIVCVRGGLVYK
ncbi:HNH endonuclease, partial [Corynebacterium diphtheriae bv. gravis]|nr:HNH endonuclease [Corynebacterium diphtheriae bv. gravis]